MHCNALLLWPNARMNLESLLVHTVTQLRKDLVWGDKIWSSNVAFPYSKHKPPPWNLPAEQKWQSHSSWFLPTHLLSWGVAQMDINKGPFWGLFLLRCCWDLRVLQVPYKMTTQEWLPQCLKGIVPKTVLIHLLACLLQPLFFHFQWS